MTAKEMLDAGFMEMRWRCLSLAADLDRLERAAGGAENLKNDPRLQTLRRALGALIDGQSNRAEQVQMLFSDMSPPPPLDNPQSAIRNPK